MLKRKRGKGVVVGVFGQVRREGEKEKRKVEKYKEKRKSEVIVLGKVRTGEKR